jgi:ATP phosphoribosyltransferase regulatory subunit
MRERRIPEGMQDAPPGACADKRRLEGVLRALFAERGYAEVETPLLEYGETFAEGTEAGARRHMWKTFDRNGRTLAVRPDNTAPIVRMAAERLRDRPTPLRLCYVQDVLSFPEGEHPRLCQTTQAGVELLGDPTAEADAEVLALAVRALEAAGLRGFQVEIGEMDFFLGFMEELGLSGEEQERLRACVERKDMLAVELLLRDLRAGPEVSRRIARLPVLYGGDEVLAQAAEITAAPRCLAALDRLRRVLAALEAQGLRQYVSIDLGMVHAMHYYTGLIFRGITGQFGEPVLSGGRYDRLPAAFGWDLPAVGFALDVPRTLLAAERQALAPEAAHEPEAVTIALAKGRLAEQTASLLRAVGIDCGDLQNPGRKLVLSDPTGAYRFILVKPSDVPTYVEHGVADIGVAGKDTLLEENKALYELLDLGLGACRLCVAGKPGGSGARGVLRVATKYPNIARGYYASRGQSIEIIKLNGSVELGPLVGLSDVILDIVESGGTLSANGLEVLETVSRISARAVVNVVSLKTKGDRIRPLIAALRRMLDQESGEA